MDNTIIVAIIGLISTLAASFLSAYLTNKFTSETSSDNLKEQFENSDKTLKTTIKSQLEQQKSKLVADDISKSRIEWLQITRKYISDYMSEVNQCWYLNQQIYKLQAKNKALNYKIDQYVSLAVAPVLKSQLHDNDNDISNALSKRDEVVQKAESDYYKSIFSINPNEEIFHFLEQYIVLSQLKPSVSPKDKGKVTRIVGNEVQSYFKAEWDKAKDEIKDSSVVEVSKAVKDKNTEDADQLRRAIHFVTNKSQVHNDLYNRLQIIKRFGPDSNEYRFIMALYSIYQTV